MLYITTQNPEFGKGYFIGFDKEGLPHFQSCFDKRVKTYKKEQNARKQFDRIRETPFSDVNGTTYDIETTGRIDEDCPSCPPRYCGTCLPGDCKNNQQYETEGGAGMSIKGDPYGSPLCNGHKPQPSGTGRQKQYKYIAVDFDGTLCVHKFPEIGEPNPTVIAYIKSHAERGTKIILHTCRENDPDGGRKYLDEAVEWCAAHDVPVDAVNENPFVTFGKRKVYADIYLDDRAISVHDLDNSIRAEKLKF